MLFKGFVFITLFSLSTAIPGLFDFIDRCESIKEANVCAIVYDDENCNEGDWDPLKIMDGESRSFSILKGITNLFNYKNDIESIVVKKGCALKVYKDSDFSDGEYTFTAPANRDLFIKDLEDDDNTEYLNEDIESLRCSCSNNFLNSNANARLPNNVNRGPPLPATCQNIAAQFPNHGAIVFDDSECKVEDWDTPLALQNNEDKAWNLLSNPKEYAVYANTIESVYVKRGCSLTVYDDGDFSDDPFTFEARDYDIAVTLDSPPSTYSASQRAQIKGLDDSIRSMKLRCNF